MSKELLNIKDLHVDVEGKEILKGLTLNINMNEIHVIMGPNGAGKSVLSNVLSGNENYNVTAGSIKFCGKDIVNLSLIHI